MKIDSFYSPMPKEMTLPEFLKNYEDLFFLVEDEINQRLQTSSGFSPVLRVKCDDKQLLIVSLMGNTKVLETYNQVIPDNGHNQVVDLSLRMQEQKTMTLSVAIPTYLQPIKVTVNIEIFKYDMVKSQSITFPEDMFLKGYELLTERIQKANFNLLSMPSNKIKGFNSSYADVKAIWVYHQKQAA